jgi:hypothetical protein
MRLPDRRQGDEQFARTRRDSRPVPSRPGVKAAMADAASRRTGRTPECCGSSVAVVSVNSAYVVRAIHQPQDASSRVSVSDLNRFYAGAPGRRGVVVVLELGGLAGIVTGRCVFGCGGEAG